MISKEELFDTLNEMMDGDLSERAIEYITSDLLEKYVVFKRPNKGVVRVDDNGGLILDGRAFPEYTISKIEEWYKASMRDAEFHISKMMESYGLLEHYRKAEMERKAARREELVKEIGGDTFDELPPMIQKLVIRLVEAEFKNERD